jgi:hypothetical protein
MKKTFITIFTITSLFLMTSFANAQTDWLKGATEEQLKTLANIMPGLGTVMIEYSVRLTNAYYAAKGGNWELAGYMVKEAREIQEVGETTRPARAEALKTFEHTYLEPLDNTIKGKNFIAFKKDFNNVVKGCNGCHEGQGFPYIKYVLPKQPYAPLSMKP